MAVNVLDSSEFDEKILTAKGISLVDMYATWCGPCKMLAPIVEQVSEEISGVTFYKMDIDDASDLVMKYKVMNVPTLLVFKDGELVTKSVGVISKEEIKKLVTI